MANIMPFNDVKQLFVHFHVVIILYTLLADIQSVATLQCYICGANDNLLGCENFLAINETKYAKECATSAQSCSIQQQGNTIISRSCEDIKIDDCEMANNIEYCYCTFDLCNRNKTTKKTINISSSDVSDDEDLIEGSGFNNIISKTDKRLVTTLQPTTKATNSSYCIHTQYTLILFLLQHCIIQTVI